MDGNYNYGISSNIQSASILDKTDWRKTIHKCLENCVNAEGTTKYPQTVKSLISAVSAPYPGFDAKTLINKKITEIKEDYKKWTVDWISRNPDYWHHPGKRSIVEPDIVHSYYKEIFEYIKDLLAQKRILLYGVRKTIGGTQMSDENE
jgi:hypothetical protein